MDAAVLAVALAFAPARPTSSSPAPSPPSTTVDIETPARARFGRGEVVIDAADRPGPPPSKLRVHGEARLSLGFGVVLEDPIAAVTPAVELDLRELAPVRFAFAVPLHLRMADRAPQDRGVLRLQEWNEVGDYFALLSAFHYADAHAFGDTGRVSVRVEAGRQRDIVLGHGSLVRGWTNSLDIDRRRTGLAATTVVGARLLEQPADLSVDILLGDVAGSQILASRVGARWAGAGLGVSVAGDPTAPHALVEVGTPAAFSIGRGGTLRSSGPRGVVAAALDFEYMATDDWRWRVGPYVDLDLVANLGKGAHVGGDGEVLLGRRRGLMLGGTAELTVGSAGYDPAYFDVFYGAQRWQSPPLGRPSDAADDSADQAAPKYAFVRDEVPKAVGGMGALRMSHRAGGMARIEYRMRPGPLGHTFSLVVGVDVPEVGLFARFAHRGNKHGFEPKLAGTIAQLELRVPVIRYVEVEIAAGWTFAIRPDTRTGAASDAGFLAGGGLVLAGVAGRIPW